MAKVKISELPSLSPATLDTTFVVGISGSTTYKISINQLTSSLDTTFATDLVTAALSSSLDGKLSTSSYSTDSASFNSRIISGSAVAGTISSSTQISDLGFVTGSYTTINSFNSLTQSFNSISQSFNVISGSVGTIDFSTLATTGSNIFSGSQTISGGLSINNSGYSWSFESNGRTKIPNITFNSDRGTGMVGIKPAPGREFQIETSTAESSVGPWSFGLDGTLSAPVGANIIRVGNLVTTSSFNTFTHSIDSRVDSLENATSSYLTSLNGAISSSAQVLNGSDIFSSSAQLPIGLVSGSSQILNGSGIFSSSAQLPTGLISSSTQFPSNLVSGSSQISTLGFITGSYISSSTYTTDSASFNSRIICGSAVAGTISGSAQITAFGFISSSQTINTSSFATTGSNSFNGNQTITGSLIVSTVAVVNGGITIPTGSVISLTSGSSLFVDASGSITGSLTGSVFGIGDVVAFSSSVNSRIISGSVVAGTISGSSQLTSSFDTRYAISASFVSSSNLSSIQTITSASYAALTPVSGTLYIIIG